MSFENPSQIIRSWGLTKNFAAGPTTVDKLVPPTYGKVRTPFCQTWRSETLSSNLNWGSQNFSYYLPESLRVVSSMFLRIALPTNAGGTNYKPFPGKCIHYVVGRGWVAPGAAIAHGGRLWIGWIGMGLKTSGRRL